MTPDYDQIDLTGLKVLVSENNKHNLIRIYEMLTSIGIEVVVSYKNIDAVEKHLTDKPDLIIMNMEMKEISNVDYIRTIKKNEPVGRKTPVIGMVSQLPDKKKKAESQNSPPDEYILSSFILDDLYKIFEKYIPKKIVYLFSVNKTLTTSYQVFNEKALIDMIGNDTSLIENLMTMFLKDIPELIVKLKLAFLNKYFSEIEYFAHSIKGIAANVYAEKLKITAYHIEIIGKSKDLVKLEEGKKLLNKLEMDFDDIKKIFVKYIGKN